MRKILVIVTVLLVGFSVNCYAADFVFHEAINSRLITKSGSQIGKGAVEQTMLGVDVDGFYINLWKNYGFSERKDIETDLVVGKKFSSGKFSGDFNFQRYMTTAGNENMLEINLKYNSDANVSVVWTKQVTGGVSLDRNRFYFELSKPIAVNKIILTPFISIAYSEDFYHSTGWAHLTPKVRVDYALSKNISIFAQGSFQKGLLSGKGDLSYGGGGVRMFF